MTCERLGKWFGGCRFEPRYDEVSAGANFDDARGYSISELRRLAYYERYVHDICVRCGRVVQRQTTNVPK